MFTISTPQKDSPISVIALVQGFDLFVLQSNPTEVARLRAEMFLDEVFSWSLLIEQVRNLKDHISEVSRQWPANGRDSPTHSDAEIAVTPT